MARSASSIAIQVALDRDPGHHLQVECRLQGIALIFVPLPFVVAVLLLALLAAMLRSQEQSGGIGRSLR